MKNAKKGVVAAFTGVIMGIGLTTAISYLVNKSILPDYSTLLFAVFCIIGNLLTLKSMRRGAAFYTIGWLAGSFMLKDLMGPIDIIFNLIAPAGILGLRMWLWVRRAFR